MQTFQKNTFNLVLRIGALAYFHVCFLCRSENETLVLRYSYHQFKKIVEMKRLVSVTTERPLNGFQLQNANGNILNDNLNLYKCGVFNEA